MNSEGLNVCPGIIYVKFPKVKYRQQNAEQIYEDPDGVENIVTIGTLQLILWGCFRDNFRVTWEIKDIKRTFIKASTYSRSLRMQPWLLKSFLENIIVMLQKLFQETCILRILFIYIERRKKLAWTRGQEGSSITAPAFAARAPLRNVGPRLTVTLANLNCDREKRCVMGGTLSPYHEKTKSHTLRTILQ